MMPKTYVVCHIYDHFLLFHSFFFFILLKCLYRDREAQDKSNKDREILKASRNLQPPFKENCLIINKIQ